MKTASQVRSSKKPPKRSNNGSSLEMGLRRSFNFSPCDCQAAGFHHDRGCFQGYGGAG